jgi:hypothetical protein
MTDTLLTTKPTKLGASVKGDTDYTAFARQLQDNWRVKNNFPIGSYKNVKGEVIQLGNYIERKFAFKTGANFLSPRILSVVKNTLNKKELGAKIEETRLFTNLLSSQPLAFNLFSELSLDKKLATEFFCDFFPNRISEVNEIIFEHSSGRGNCEYTCDHSAFDVFVLYKPINGNKGFIGIEVKYAENLKDKPSKHKARYEELTDDSKLFKNGSKDLLKLRPIQQICRDHLLSIAHLNHKKENFDDGFFVYLFPKRNEECQEAVDKYIMQFESYDPVLKKHNERLTGFYIRYVDDFVAKLRQLNKEDWTKELIDRYLGKK